MSTDFQTARTALGARLRELRVESGLTGKQLSQRLAWPPSKISKLEHGRQTPTAHDLHVWAAEVGAPQVTEELVGRLRALETHYASWRRQLAAGTRARQEAWHVVETRAGLVCNLETACIPGLLQTPPYARWMFTITTQLHTTPPDIEDGVRARMQRQQALYEPGRRFSFLVWEAALRTRICPTDVLIGQLDRLAGTIGMDTVDLGIVPFDGALPVVPTHGFWVYDEDLVMVETIGAELRLVEQTEVQLYLNVWHQLSHVAVRDGAALRLLTRARASLATEQKKPEAG